MASYTEKYKLKKPAATDFVDIADINGNTDIIEAELAKRPVLGADGKLPSNTIPAVTSTAIETALGYKPVNAFYVTVTPASSGDQTTGTADKTDAEIYAAYLAGSPVFCNVASAGHYSGMTATLPLFAAYNQGDDYMFAFCGSGVPRTSTAQDPPGAVTVTKNHYGWHVFYDTLAKTTDIPTALPNPQNLTLRLGNKDTVYNGSSSKLFEVPAPDELIFSTVTTEAVQTFTTTTDNSGQAFNLKKWVLEIYCPFANPGNYWSYIDVTVPGGSPNSTTHDLARFEPVTGGDDFKYGAFRYEGSADSGVGRWIGTGTDRGGVAPVLNNLTSITMRAGGATVNALPIGTKITLKGVRA